MRRTMSVVVTAMALLGAGVSMTAVPSSGANAISADTVKALTLRSLGPAYTTGRVQDIAVDPNHPTVYYVASAAGGVWKTENRGQTWAPIFDSGGAFNLCCIVVDPKNS